ncbi:uncharacterized protein [Antedon mediterranea]|uniref:uncharacterized protein n=1 Tax=Antedon mediterranea TaxID=105859 RepID=UPI003AF6842F
MGTDDALSGLISLGVTVGLCLAIYYVIPFVKTKDYKEGVCTVVEHNVTIISDPECECYDDYKLFCKEGNYPCLMITVLVLDAELQNRTAMLYKSDKDYVQDSKCSYPICDSYDLGKKRETEEYSEFREEYTIVDKMFDCFYDEEKDEAVIERKVTKAQAIGACIGLALLGLISAVWPSICILCK